MQVVEIFVVSNAELLDLKSKKVAFNVLLFLRFLKVPFKCRFFDKSNRNNV